MLFGGEAPRPMSLRTLEIDVHRSPLDRNSSVNWYFVGRFPPSYRRGGSQPPARSWV